MLSHFVVAFFDDILVYTSGTIEQHMDKVEQVFDRLCAAGHEANIKRCRFGVKQILFVGHIVTRGTILPNQAKVRAVSDWAAPTSESQLRSFLGFVNYYHEFVPAFALTASPL
jgi:hypothetical protein